MNGYKLVPVEPTQEMVEAAADAYMPFGDMDLALRMAILAAPAVQGEPQPAAHQPCPEGVREGAPYDDPAFESLCREYGIWGTAAAAQCAVFWGAGKRVAEQQPAPDVAGLVEALEQIERWDGFPSTGKVWEDSGEPVSYAAAFGSNGERDFMRGVARKALAAHRKDPAVSEQFRPIKSKQERHRDELEELLSEYSFDIGEDYSKAADAILSRYTLEPSHDNQ